MASEVTVKNLFVNVFKDTTLGYIHIIKVGNGGEAQEVGCETISAVEMASMVDKVPKAYYKIGEYWYLVL